MNNYRLTQRAADDLIEIEFHSIVQFGHRQAEKYKHSLRACFELLAGQPKMGRLARNVGVGVRRHEHGSHVILYEVVTDGLLILAVVHARNMQDIEL